METKKVVERLIMTLQWSLFAAMFFTSLFKQQKLINIRWLGFIIIIAALYVLIISYTAHAGVNTIQLSSSPEPNEKAELVTGGIYKYIRHPIYLSFIILLWGMAVLLGYFSSLCVAVLSIILFYLKTLYEENLLLKCYPGYKEYKRKTGRFLPRRK